jgi:inner membrane protein
MTGRTHDLAGLTTLTAYVTYQPLMTMSLATIIVCIGANMFGAVAPDLDQPTASLWHKIPAGSLVGRIIKPLLGSHRLISHSILGIFLANFLMKLLLGYTHKFLIVDEKIVLMAFMFGFVSHLIMDTFTKEGVPWLFPIPIRFGFPPFKFLRISTDGMIERGLIYPGLMILNGYLIYTHYSKFLEFFTRQVIK